MTALVVTNLSCLKLTRTAIKADKQKRQLVIGYTLIVPNQNRQWRLKTKQAQPTAAHFSVSPPENIWLALRAAKEKTAHLRRNSDFVPCLVDFYNEIQTYFSTKC